MESIKDIVREMRAHTKGKAEDAWYTPALWARLCDRIEAAEENGYRALQAHLKKLEDAYTKQVEINKELVEENAKLLAAHKTHEEYRLRVKPWPYSGWTTIGETCNSVEEASVLLEARKIFRDNDHARRIERRDATDWKAVKEDTDGND